MTTAAELRAAKRAALRTELARLRFDAGLTIREVVEACGISSTSALSDWENGIRRPNQHYAAVLRAFYEQDGAIVYVRLTTRTAGGSVPNHAAAPDSTFATTEGNTGHSGAPVARWNAFMPGGKR
jgi:DNA-binding transcriptional regulator YiaG